MAFNVPSSPVNDAFIDERISVFLPLGGGSSTIQQLGMSVAAVGTVGSTSLSTNTIVNSIHKVIYTGAASSSSIGGFRTDRVYFYRGDIPRSGGFKLSIIWGPHAGFTGQAFHRGYCGAIGDITAPTDVEPSTRLNIIGIGWDNADTQVQLMHNDGIGTATKIALGANFPRPTTDQSDLYKIDLWCNPNVTSVNYKITNIANGSIATGVISTNIPAPTILLGLMGTVSAAGSLRAISSALSKIVLKTNF